MTMAPKEQHVPPSLSHLFIFVLFIYLCLFLSLTVLGYHFAHVAQNKDTP